MTPPAALAPLTQRLQQRDAALAASPRWGRLWRALRRGVLHAVATAQRFGDAQGVRHGAAVAFYAVFSIAPVLVVVTGVMVWFLGDAQAQDALLRTVRDLVGAREAETLARMLAQRPAVDFSFNNNLSVAGWVALLSTLIGASGVFVELKAAVQAMVGEPVRGFDWWYLLRVRLVAVGVVLGCGFLLSVAMVAQGLALLALHMAATRWPVLAPVLGGAELLWSWGVMTVLFAAMLRWLPDQRLPWRCAGAGAAVAAALFMLGRWAISLYVARTAAQSALGAAGSFAALLVWIYWSSQIFLIGAAWAVVQRDRDRGLPPTAAHGPG